jgi:alpha-tubulin suppressor-like RCC1 family protein
MNAPRRTTRRATLLACAAIAIGTACGSEGDARDAGAVDSGLSDAGVPDGGAVDGGQGDGGAVDAGVADAGPLRAVALSAASAAHACAVLSDGTVRCWGLNDNGQLGVSPSESRTRCRVRGSTPAVNNPCETTPRAVAGVTDARQVSTGNGSTCVLRADRSVWCWGLNNAGELGTGGTSLQAAPTPTRLDLPPVRQVALGAFHGCALLMDGTVRCWGANRFSQTGTATAASPMQCDEGDGTPIPCVPTPTAVAGLTGVLQLSAGRNHTCALGGDHTLRCWGLNDSAQLGTGRLDPDTAPQATPTAVALTEVAEVSSGGSHTCARRADGSLQCWGWAALGQLGGVPAVACDTASGSVQCARAPGAVPGLAGVVSVSAGRFHTCVALSGGGASCFGRDDNGQVGGGVASTGRCSFSFDNYPCSLTPRPASVTNAASVSVGDYHSCALTTDGAVRCWGNNTFGQLGNGATDDQNAPVSVRLLP